MVEQEIEILVEQEVEVEIVVERRFEIVIMEEEEIENVIMVEEVIEKEIEKAIWNVIDNKEEKEKFMIKKSSR